MLPGGALTAPRPKREYGGIVSANALFLIVVLDFLVVGIVVLLSPCVGVAARTRSGVGVVAALGIALRAAVLLVAFR